jgi:tetratricopeptide (TPR) repeat protein
MHAGNFSKFMKSVDNNDDFVKQATNGYLYSMKNLLYSQAVFFASAISSHVGESAESAEMLAKAFYMDGQTKRAMDTLAPFVELHVGTSTSVNVPISRLSDDGLLIYSRCCFDLEIYAEVVSTLYPATLQGPKHTPTKSPSSFTLRHLDKVVASAPGLLLMGKALERMNDRSGALECYSKCLDISPIMFEAFERLSALSADNSRFAIPAARFASTYFNQEAFKQCSILSVDQEDVLMPSSSSSSRSISLVPSNQDAVVPPSVRMNSPVRGRPPRPSAGGSVSTPVAPQRRRGVSPPSISKPPQYLQPAQPVAVPIGGSHLSLRDYIHAIGTAVFALDTFELTTAIEALSRLPVCHYESAYVQGMLGRAFLESGKFIEAESAFSSALKVSPSGIIDFIDSYSSVLWQLKKEVELAHLCTHGLRIANKQKAFKLWVAIGNSFSLQKEYESAIKFFNRALQINAHYPYAHVLVGHEFFAMDKFDRAKQCYQRALELDPRSYNAYWGLGQIFLKQEEYANAKFNFVKALEINPKSSTVRFSLALVALALKENDVAYQQLCIAVELNPKNAPAMCQKGIMELTVYGKPDVATATLEKALHLAPTEPVIHVLLGRLYSTKQGMREQAMACFNTAMELTNGSKDHLGIKQCIEEIDVVAK